MALNENPMLLSFRSMLEDLDRRLPDDMFQRKVREFLNSVTHDPLPQRMIHQFGKKLLLPQWREDWRNSGWVFSVLFGDIEEKRFCSPRKLHQLVTELVASEAGSQLPCDRESSRWRIQSALRLFLRQFDPSIPLPPAEFNPVASEKVPPLPLGFFLSREFPADHLLGSEFEFSDPHVEIDPELLRQLAMFDELTLEKPHTVDPVELALASKPTLSARYCWLRNRTLKVASFSSIEDDWKVLRFADQPTDKQIRDAFQNLQKALRSIDCAPSVEVNLETKTVSMK